MTLLPCPFCGGGETRISENRHSPTMSGNGGLISVEINHWCPAVPGQPSRNTVTRTGRDHASAIAAWNRRAPSADHFPDAGKMVAYTAGAEAMREACILALRLKCGAHQDTAVDAIRALPVPEEPE